MRSRRSFNLSVYAGAALCCALLLCAAQARGDTPAAAITNSPTESILAAPLLPASTAARAMLPEKIPEAAQTTSAVPVTSAALATTAAAAVSVTTVAPVTTEVQAVAATTAVSATSATKATLEDNPENHPIGGTRTAARSASSSEKPVKDNSTSLWGVVAPLAAVLLVLGLLFWAVKKYLPGMRRLGGSGTMKVMARTHLSPRQSIALVRVGRRLILIGQSADSLESLGSIDDAEEVSELLGQCESGKPQSATASFQKVFNRMDKEFAAAEATTETPPETTGADEEMGRVRSELESLTRKVREVADRRP
jgi:flagellar biogenesis protein FliO